MAPGQWNGKNYGGLHTGTGKYQTGGVYSHNGQRYKRVPTRDFTVGQNVHYIGSHTNFMGQSGKVITKVGDYHRSSRSTIKVELGDGRYTYFHKNSLQLSGNSLQL